MNKEEIKKIQKIRLAKRRMLQQMYRRHSLSKNKNTNRVVVDLTALGASADLPISTVKIKTSNRKNRNSLCLMEARLNSKDAAKMYIAKGSRISRLIDRTNSNILAKYKTGEIDISGDNL